WWGEGCTFLNLPRCAHRTRKMSEGAAMTLHRIFTVTAALVGMSTAAHAGTLASGAVFGSSSQTSAFCFVRNVGKSTVPAPLIKIFNQNGLEVASSNNCTGTLDPQEACLAGANIVASLAHACTATVAGSTKNFRGTFDIRQGNVVLQSEILR